jgi:hypothetical protein
MKNAIKTALVLSLFVAPMILTVAVMAKPGSVKNGVMRLVLDQYGETYQTRVPAVVASH